MIANALLTVHKKVFRSLDQFIGQLHELQAFPAHQGCILQANCSFPPVIMFHASCCEFSIRTECQHTLRESVACTVSFRFEAAAGQSQGSECHRGHSCNMLVSLASMARRPRVFERSLSIPWVDTRVPAALQRLAVAALSGHPLQPPTAVPHFSTLVMGTNCQIFHSFRVEF